MILRIVGPQKNLSLFCRMCYSDARVAGCSVFYNLYYCVAGCVTVAHESPVLLLEAAPVVVGAGPEEADLRREPRDDGRTDVQHDQPLVRRGTGRR